MAKRAEKLAPFITLEGGEGAGKSTQIGQLQSRIVDTGARVCLTFEPGASELLQSRIVDTGARVCLTFEPGASELGAELRRLVSQPRKVPPSPRAELLMYLADRAQHVETEILPALSSGSVVLCDRFSDSSEVYQGRARGLGCEEVRRLNRWVCGDVWPDLTLYLDLEPETGLARVRKRQGDSGLDRMELEALEFHHKVRQGFLDQAAAEPERIKIIDASRSVDQVAAQIWDHAEPLIREWIEHAA